MPNSWRRNHRTFVTAVLASVILIAAQLVAGAGPATADYGAMIHPTSGRINSVVGGCGGDRPSHAGIDIGTASGNAIVAAYSGTVTTRVVNFSTSGYGNYVVITHASGYTTLYAHMRDAPPVALDAQVSQGQTIGAIGSTGNSTGPHLHFEMRRNGTNIANQGYACGQNVTRGSAIPMDFPGLGAIAPPPPASGKAKDFNDDGSADLLAIDTAGALWVYPGTGGGAFGAAVQAGSGWQTMSLASGGVDFTSDGRMDIVGRTGDGNLWLYPRTSPNTFGAAVRIGSGWQVIDAIVPGDFTGDGRADIAARRLDGTLWVYPGNGAGGFGNAAEVGFGWSSMTAILGGADYDGDARADLIARDGAGYLWLYRGTGTGNFDAVIRAGQGWSDMTAIVGGGDYTGDGRADIVSRSSDGRLWTYPGLGSANFGGAIYSGFGWNVMTHLM